MKRSLPSCFAIAILLGSCGGNGLGGSEREFWDANLPEAGSPADAREADTASTERDQALASETDTSTDVSVDTHSPPLDSIDAVDTAELDASLEDAAIDLTSPIEVQPFCRIDRSGARPVVVVDKVGTPFWQGGPIVDGRYVLVAGTRWLSGQDAGTMSTPATDRAVLEFKGNTLTFWFMMAETGRDSWTMAGNFSPEGSTIHVRWVCSTPGFMIAPTVGVDSANYTADGAYFITDARLVGGGGPDSQLVFQRQ